MEEQHGKRRRNKKQISIVPIRALQGHSGRNLIDPSLQDNVLIPDDFFEYIYHVVCAINLHSIINSGLIPGGQNLSNRHTVFFLSVNPMDKEHKDPDTIDLDAPRLAQYMHKAWKETSKYCVLGRHQPCSEERIEVLSTRSNAIILDETLPASCIPKAVGMGTGEIIYTKVYESPRPPPKISLRNDRMKEVGSEVARQPEGEVARQVKSSQSSQPNPNPDHDRTGKHVVCTQRGALHSQEIETRSFREEAVRHDRMEKLVVCRDENHERPTVVCSEQASHPRFSREGQNLILEDETNHDRTVKLVVCRDAHHERSMLNEVDIDFRIPGLPHSVVKQADNDRVRELLKKIENHPHRQSLQRDLQQNNAYNPFSEKSKKK